MDYVLGVDCGGSKTTIKVANTSGKKIIQTFSGPASYKSVGGIAKAIENLNRGVFKAIKSLKKSKRVYFTSSCFGMAGYDTQEDFDTFKRIVFNEKLKKYLNCNKTIIVNDNRLGLEAGSRNKNKIIIDAGSGSNCLGINEEGEQAKASGWEYILADEGSAYQAGLKALKAVMRAYDGRGEGTLLKDVILKELNLKDVPNLVKWIYEIPFPREKISYLAKTICHTAELGDKVSIKILTEEAEEAAISIKAVARKLGFKDNAFDLVLVGGLFKCEKYFKNILIEILIKEYLKINIIPLVVEPVQGAIQLAIGNLFISVKRYTNLNQFNDSS